MPRFSALSRSLTIAAALAVSACQTEADAPKQTSAEKQPAPQVQSARPLIDLSVPAKPDPAARATCQAQGGTYQIGGLARQYVCFRPQPDAGQACRTENDCTGFCLAETKQCSAQTPIFGCFDLLDADGRQQTICID
ncbi:hypothetical protein [Thalassovita mediterranea]|jgi:hypothetical protein|uniref:Secreted protein n=1 Tax=Thalassovita mediterranea TaxID=340021 RepID=A0A0P1H7H6_9RHOB|nr:hypothetical protein [Thalassovita mediterranea]MCG7573733.1 hypothetical protein [Phaeobacter sp. CNT1-3]CUH85926.1 hypothetical protein TM5383_03169 [Thalassovita mediterranea]SIS32832.1 hypothetical protein SAMN05421685_107120 [Thalassovita mediterranea]